jgi:hypothetical protein
MTEPAANETTTTTETTAPAQVAAPKGHAARLAGILAEKDVATEPVAAGAEGAAPADGAAKPAEGEAKKSADAATKDPTAARFAALARENEKAVRARQEADTKATLVAEREAQVNAFAESLKAREAKIAEAEARGHDLLSREPETLFKHLESLGIDSMAKLEAVAKKAWRKPGPATPAADDPNRPLTRAEFEELQKRAETSRAEKAASAELVRISSDETKYEATNLVFSDDERVSHGQRIAAGLVRAGKAFSLADIADAVEALAQRQPRWQKIQQRSAKSAEAGTSTAGKPAMTAPASIARAAPGPKTPSNDSATDTAPSSTAANGHRERHKDRVRRLIAGG